MGSPFAQGLAAVQRSLKPFLLIQSIAIGIALAYALSPGFRDGLEGVARLREAGGLPFAMIATVLASVGLPEIAGRLTGTRSELGSWRLVLLYTLFFAFIGLLVYGLQALLARLFGTGTDPLTVLKKALFDLSLFSIFVTMPLSTTVFLYRDSGFSLRGVTLRGWTARYIPMLVTGWSFWIPSLYAVYAMPPSLQFPLFLFVQGAWSLLMHALSVQETVA